MANGPRFNSSARTRFGSTGTDARRIDCQYKFRAWFRLLVSRDLPLHCGEFRAGSEHVVPVPELGLSA